MLRNKIPEVDRINSGAELSEPEHLLYPAAGLKAAVLDEVGAVSEG